MTKKATKASPDIEIKKTAERDLELATESDFCKKSFGTSDTDFIVGFAEQLLNAAPRRQPDPDRGFNFIKSVVASITPKDPIEAMLASQMATIQIATMTLSNNLANVETIAQQDSAVRGLTKLTRCFAAQVEALKKYRSNGQQKVTVEHVTVNDGGQAIVGPVNQGGDGGANKR